MPATTIPLVQRRTLGKIIEITFDIKDKEFNFKAGQYFKLELKELKHADPKGKTRIFNALSSPNNSDFLTFAFMDSQSGYKKTIKEISLGTEMSISGPYGMFTIPNNNSTPIVMVADDIGITPCMSMILHATEEQFPFKITVFFSKQLPYKTNIDDIKSMNKNMELVPYDQFNHNTVKKIKDYQKCSWYVAGTPRKTEEIKMAILKCGVPQNSVKVEEFTGYQ